MNSRGRWRAVTQQPRVHLKYCTELVHQYIYSIITKDGSEFGLEQAMTNISYHMTQHLILGGKPML
jgi:hypothetical protein